MESFRGSAKQVDLGLLDDAPFGVVLTEANGSIVAVNPAFASLAKRSRHDLMYSAITEVCADDITASVEGGQRRSVLAQPDGTGAPVNVAHWRAGGRHVIVVDCAKSRLSYDQLDAVRRATSTLADHLRHSLAGIGSALDVLIDRARLDRDEVAVVEEILARLRTLHASVGDLADFSRPLAPVRQRACIGEMVRATMSALVEQGEVRGELELQLEVDGADVDVDPWLLRQALRHLVLNADEEMLGRGVVAVAVRQCANQVAIDVSDAGSGWDGKTQPHMFEPFVTSKTQHLGVGLSIARRIARVHGGDLTCTRTGTSGTVMSLTVPLAADRVQLRVGGDDSAPVPARRSAPLASRHAETGSTGALDPQAV